MVNRCCRERLTRLRSPFGRTRIFLESPDWNQAQLQPTRRRKGPSPSGHRYHLILGDESAGHAIFDAVTQGKYILPNLVNNRQP